MFEYKDPRWISQVNDFGDDYHKEVVKSDFVDNETIARLEKIKRRYRDFDSYVEAMTLVNSYLHDLVRKYGGKKRFKMLYQLGMIKDYIPVIPVLRKIKQTKLYIDTNTPHVFDDQIEQDHSHIVERDTDKKVRVSFSMKIDGESEFDSLRKGGNEGIRNAIAEEISMIEQWYRNNTNRVTKMSKKARRRQIKKQKIARKHDEMTATDKINEYYRKKDLEIYSDFDPEALVNYKGTTMTCSQKEEYEAYEKLRGYGFTFGKKTLSKSVRKIVRRKEKKRKKIDKKEAKAAGLRKKYLNKFTDGEYNTFNDFEKEVHSFIGNKIRGND